MYINQLSIVNHISSIYFITNACYRCCTALQNVQYMEQHWAKIFEKLDKNFEKLDKIFEKLDKNFKKKLDKNFEKNDNFDQKICPDGMGIYSAKRFLF